MANIKILPEIEKVHIMTGAVRTVTRLGATSYKPQASSTKLIERQAASFKPRAASIKLQAASYKLSNIFSFIKFPVSSGERLSTSGSPGTAKFSIRFQHIVGVFFFKSSHNLRSGFNVTTAF